MQLTQQEYEKIVSEVETAFAEVLAKAEAESEVVLAKSEESEEEKDEEDEEDEKVAKADGEHEEAIADVAGEKDAEEATEAPAEHQDYSEEELAELHALYDSMPEGELHAHLQALENAMAKFHAEEAPAPEAEGAAPSPDMDKCGDMKVIAKSEESVESELMKSEVASKDKEITDLKKSIEELTAAMTGFLESKVPARKAITEIRVLEKSESEIQPKQVELTPQEIIKKLSDKASEPSLAKSDRDLINSYTLKRVGIEKIQHLLK